MSNFRVNIYLRVTWELSCIVKSVRQKMKLKGGYYISTSTIINTQNLAVGMVVHNYKHLCQLLNAEVKGGTSKKLQLQHWERYFSFDRVGHKYIITEILDKPIPPPVRIDSIYIPLIDSLLQCELYNEVNLTKHYTRRSMLCALGMANQNYEAWNTPKKNDLNLTTNPQWVKDCLPQCASWEVGHFHNRAHNRLNSVLFSALNSMQRRRILFYEQHIITVSGHVHTLATPDEVYQIEALRKIVREACNISAFSSSTFSTLQAQKKTNKCLRELYGWDYVYTQYGLHYNPEFIWHELGTLTNAEILDRKQHLRQELNTLLCNAMVDNAMLLYSKNQESLKDSTSNKSFDYNKQSNGLYLQNQQDLAELFLRL